MALQSSTTFSVSNKLAEEHWFQLSNKEVSLEEQVKRMQQYARHECTEVLQMSRLPNNIVPSNNGLVNTVLDAYNDHHNLILRPDDIWAAIMIQFSFYINKNSEEFREKFVGFQGKRGLAVCVDGSLRTSAYDDLVKLMSNEIDKNLVDPEFKKWILPSFSTTTENDLVAVGVVFMACMKKYLDYTFRLRCGIPSITLEGTVQDWEDIQGRLEKLRQYKLDRWYDMLKPILKQFVNAKKGKVDLSFWQRIVHFQVNGSGPTYVSGWITAFCMFDAEGNWNEQARTLLNSMSSRRKWLRLETNQIPTGTVEVDVKIDDNGTEYKSVMFAGHLAAEVKEDGKTLQPTLGWIMALKK